MVVHPLFSTHSDDLRVHRCRDSVRTVTLVGFLLAAFAPEALSSSRFAVVAPIRDDGGGGIRPTWTNGLYPHLSIPSNYPSFPSLAVPPLPSYWKSCRLRPTTESFTTSTKINSRQAFQAFTTRRQICRYSPSASVTMPNVSDVACDLRGYRREDGDDGEGNVELVALSSFLLQWRDSMFPLPRRIPHSLRLLYFFF